MSTPADGRTLRAKDPKRAETAASQYFPTEDRRELERAAVGTGKVIDGERIQAVLKGGTFRPKKAQATGDPVVEVKTCCFEDDGFAPVAHRDAGGRGPLRRDIDQPDALRAELSFI